LVEKGVRGFKGFLIESGVSRLKGENVLLKLLEYSDQANHA